MPTKPTSKRSSLSNRLRKLWLAAADAVPKVDRYKLHFGPYSTPRCRLGSRVVCEIRGTVVVTGFTEGRIPWPIAGVPGEVQRGLVVYRGLAKSLRKESAKAIYYWFGVGATSVWRWRKALGINPDTAGSRKLWAAQNKRNWPKSRLKTTFAHKRNR